MKNVMNKIETHRSWIGKRFYYIFISIGMIFSFLGGIFYVSFVNAPSFSFRPGFSGFGVARNYTAVPWREMVIGIGIDPPELWFQYFANCAENGTYNFIFVFPFYITRQMGSSGNMSFSATARGSAVWTTCNVNDIYLGWRDLEIWGAFSIDNTFQSGSRGSYTFVLPFGMGIHPDVWENVWRELRVPLHTPDANISLQVGLPRRYGMTATFPPVLSGPNPWVTPTNKSISSMEWKFQTLRDSVTIQCEDQAEITAYETLLFTSGIFVSLGIPIVTSTAYDAIKEWSRADTRKKPKPRVK